MKHNRSSILILMIPSLTVLFFLLLFDHSSGAINRIALVIGNGNYQYANPLDNPVNDADDMAASLTRLGFSVIKETNTNRQLLVKTIKAFGKRLRCAEIGLFYYAGHGVQINGVNYLIPVDAACQTSADVNFEAVEADWVLAQMEQAESKLNIVILDACRDNPFRSFRSAEKGLAPIHAPKGTIVAFATAPGSKAEDGVGRNGTYTANLLKHIHNPSLNVLDIFRETGLGVMADTNDKQVPWTSSTPVPKFYLTSSSAVAQEQPNEAVTTDSQQKMPAQANPSFPSRPKNYSNIWTESITNMEFVWVPGGCFNLGGNGGFSNKKLDQGVCLEGFWLGKYEVTQKEWSIIMGNNPSESQKGDRFPVETISWNDVNLFIKKLNVKTGQSFAMPSEVQWEYAARSGGKNQKYSGGNDVDLVAWCGNNSDGATHEVGTKAPNDLGLHDMSGNVWEWCNNSYAKVGTDRVLRGGSWSSWPASVRCTTRLKSSPNNRFNRLGFRLLRKD